MDNIVLSRPMEGPGRAIGTLPGDKNEKMYDWLIPLTGTMRQRIGASKFDYNLKTGIIEFCPLNQIKGRSFDDSFVIIDEAEDIDRDTMKSVVTRIGQNAKVVINGDIKQKHIRQESGLGWLIYLIRKYNLPIPIVEFTIEDCVRGPITKMFLEVFEMEEEENE
jgi:phosphate starvation-inducible PhoH-like protein